jgi:hypothetical protein
MIREPFHRRETSITVERPGTFVGCPSRQFKMIVGRYVLSNRLNQRPSIPLSSGSWCDGQVSEIGTHSLVIGQGESIAVQASAVTGDQRECRPTDSIRKQL